MNFNVGDALTSIKTARDSKVERDYQDSLNDIQEKYTGVLDVEGGVQKAGATTLGAIGVTKGVKDLYTKYKEKVADFKQKVQDMKDKASGKKSSDKDEDADNDGEAEVSDETKSDVPDGDNPNEIAYSSDNPGVPQESSVSAEADAEPTGVGEFNIEENPFDVGGSDLMQGVKDFGGAVKDRVMQVVRQQQEPQVNETELAPAEGEIPDTELGAGRIPSTEPSGRGSGDIELTARGDNNQPSTETSDDGFTGTGDDGADALADVTGDVEATTDAVADTTSAVTDAAATAGDLAGTAAATAGDVAATAGLEGAGAVLDATGIGAPIGAILGIIGLVVGSAATIGSTIAEGVSSGGEQSDTKDAQTQEESDLANPPDYAGKFASNVRTSVAGFL